MVTTTHAIEISVVHQLSLKLEAWSSKLIRTPRESQGEGTGIKAMVLKRKTKTKNGKGKEDIRGTGELRKEGAKILEVTGLQVQEVHVVSG